MVKKMKNENVLRSARFCFFEKIVFVEVIALSPLTQKKIISFLPITCSKIKFFEKQKKHFNFKNVICTNFHCQNSFYEYLVLLH